MSMEQHVNDLELAAFVDGGLDPDARRRVAAHLVACDDCRAVVAAAGALLEMPRPRRRTGRSLAVGGLAVAATILFAVTFGRRETASPARTRDIEAIGRTGLVFTPAAPPDGAVVRADTLSFSWRPAGTEATYQLTVSTSAGAIVWTARTLDTSVTLPASVATQLAAGQNYYWQVDAILPDLRSASTGPRRFSPVRP